MTLNPGAVSGRIHRAANKSATWVNPVRTGDNVSESFGAADSFRLDCL